MTNQAATKAPNGATDIVSQQGNRLPHEIMKRIVEYSEETDLFLIRKACRYLNAFAGPYLFTSICLAFSYKVLDKVNNIVKSRFRDNVTTVYLSPGMGAWIEKAAYNDIVKEKLEKTGRYDKRREHTARGYEMHYKKRHAALRVRSSPELAMELLGALNACRNLKRIVLITRRDLNLSNNDLAMVSTL